MYWLIRVSDNDRTALLGWMLGASFPSKVRPTKSTLALKRRAAPKQVRILSEILHPLFLSSTRMMLSVYRKLQITFSAITKDNRKILMLESRTDLWYGVLLKLSFVWVVSFQRVLLNRGYQIRLNYYSGYLGQAQLAHLHSIVAHLCSVTSASLINESIMSCEGLRSPSAILC